MQSRYDRREAADRREVWKLIWASSIGFPPKPFDCSGGLAACRFFLITYNSKRKDQPGKVANPARCQLNRGNEYFPAAVRT